MKTITQTAVSNLKYNKTRSVLIMIAILLTSCLLMIIGSSGMSLSEFQKANIGQQSGEFEAGFVRLSQEQFDKISHHALVDKMGYTQGIGTIEMTQADGSMSFIDQNAQEMTYTKLTEGKMPEKENEFAGHLELIKSMGGTGKIGETITIPYRILGEGEIIKKDFVVSGILPSNELNELKKRYGGYVSEEFMKSAIPQESRSYSSYVKLTDGLGLNADDMKAKIKEMGKNAGLEDRNIITNNVYIMWTTDPGVETLVVCIVIGLVVVLFSCLVIYNIFYVGIIQKIQEFGKLRAIGATKRQLKGIILREGMFLAFIGIPIGILLGYAVTYFGLEKIIQNFSTNMSNDVQMPGIFHWQIIVLVLAISFLAVYVSLKKPMKVASSISPIEAMRYGEGNKKNAKTRKGYDHVTLFRLTSSNMSRNKKRTLTTIFTMGLSCVLYVVIANVGSSMDPSDPAKRNLEKGDFSIDMDYSLNDEAYPENNLNNLQKQNLLGSEIISQIEEIDGVKEVETRKLILGRTNNGTIDEDSRYDTIQILSKEDYNKRKDDIMDGDIDYDKAVASKGIIYSYGNFMESSGFSINGEIDLTIYDGDREIPFKGQIQGSTGSDSSTLVMPEETFQSLGMENDATTRLYIYCDDKKYDAVKKSLQELVQNNERFLLSSWDDELKEGQMGIDLLLVPTYAFLAILGVIGFMNMANTMITSIITRKRELGILQAMGMTNKQLGKMLQAEGIVMTLGTLLIALTLGNILGYGFFLYAKETGMMSVTNYHFPVVELGIMITVLVLMQLILSYVMSRNVQKDALIDRIRYQE